MTTVMMMLLCECRCHEIDNDVVPKNPSRREWLPPCDIRVNPMWDTTIVLLLTRMMTMLLLWLQHQTTAVAVAVAWNVSLGGEEARQETIVFVPGQIRFDLP